jgi:carbon monoxide dehydrogenase subunit G
MKLTAKAGVSFIKGKFDLDLKIINDEKKENLKLEGHGKGTGASVDFTVDFNFKQNDGMAHIKWNADVNVVGSAASMGGRMIKSAAGKYINKLIDAYKQALEAGN